MTPPPTPFQITLDASWPAERIARTILDSVRGMYGERLDVQGMHDEMEKIWVILQKDLTADERRRVGEVTHVSVPLNDLNARIVRPPSRQGYFILFDAMVDLRIWDLFTAPRNPAAWSAAYVRAAWGAEFGVAHWVGPALERLTTLDSRKDGIPDSFSLDAARDFILAHECGHLFMNHLGRGAYRQLHFGGAKLRVFDPGLRQEVEADAFARELLCRSSGRPLIVQQKGVDWLFGFLGAVAAMRERVSARRAGDPDLPTMDPAIAHRRALSWDDYNRRRAESSHAEERAEGNVLTIDRLRISVDSFNQHRAPVLADIYAELPDELLRHYERVTTAAMTDEEVAAHEHELDQLRLRAAERCHATPRRMSLGRRFRKLLHRLF
jgi:hypothetical protein